MSIFHSSRAGTRGGKDQFNWDTVKSDKDRECYLGHSLMAPTGRWQEGKDLTWYAKDRESEQQIKSAEFRSAKRIEEEALMAALGMKSMPPPAVPAPPIHHKPVIKREPTSTRVKNEPMTPSIHNDTRHVRQHLQKKKHDHQRKEDRRRRRQLKATGSDEEKHEWSENDEDDLTDGEDDSGDDDGNAEKTKQPIEQNMMSEQELDQFLVDLVKKHGLKTIQRVLKSKKEKKEHKNKRGSSASSSASDSDEEEEKKEVKREPKQKHKKKHSHKEASKSAKRQRSRSPSSPARKDRSKHRRDR